MGSPERRAGLVRAPCDATSQPSNPPLSVSSCPPPSTLHPPTHPQLWLRGDERVPGAPALHPAGRLHPRSGAVRLRVVGRRSPQWGSQGNPISSKLRAAAGTPGASRRSGRLAWSRGGARRGLTAGQASLTSLTSGGCPARLQGGHPGGDPHLPTPHAGERGPLGAGPRAVPWYLPRPEACAQSPGCPPKPRARLPACPARPPCLHHAQGPACTLACDAPRAPQEKGWDVGQTIEKLLRNGTRISTEAHEIVRIPGLLTDADMIGAFRLQPRGGGVLGAAELGGKPPLLRSTAAA